MNPEYQFSTIESAVQSAWQTADSFSVDEKSDKPKFYCLSMFPYPSGKLHMGHVRNYTIGDVISRFQRMQGKNVLQPMGWDAFGLPAENAAIKNQSAPASWTHDNINYMRKQLKSLGFAYDWKRELATCEPDYYRWEQWLFTRLFEKGLVYKKKATVNWDPVDNCVLANEQVIDGRGWRSGALVEQRDINQWFMKITDYADELLADVQELDGWPQMVRTMQSNWIGKSKGLNITFDVAGHDNMTVFTTRPDTLMGVTYVAIAPGHPIALAAAENNSNIAEFVEQCKQQKVAEAELATMEKLGIDTGLTATHPLTGDAVPIWVANFVLMSYGTGAVMSVPAHDERDHAFALKYGLPIKQVIAAPDEIDIQRQAYTEKATCVNSGDFDGLNFEQSFEAIQAQLESLTKGELVYNYRLRDWGISRQRYWGCPIPIIYCDDCGVLPVPEKDLPVVLPTDVAFDSTGKSPLPTRDDFVNVPCPSCGKAATRETDTFDTFYESSWYYARYTSYDNNEAMLDERANYWLPVDQYVGGVEHAVMHLLYARFFHKLMRDEGLVSSDEPFTRLLTQGMVLADTYCREDETGKQTWYAPADIKNETDAKGKVLSSSLKDDGQPVMHAGMSKMSKSKNNGVDPQYLIDQYGADTIRLFSMFASPPDQSMEWADAGVEGAQRFLKRLWRISYDFIEHNGTDVPEVGEYNDAQNDLRRKLHQTLSKVTDDMGRRLTYNTAIAANMELVNELSKFSDNSPAGVALKHDVISHVVLMLAPITPHICQALWEQLGYSGLLVDAAWPIVDEEALAQDSIELVVQVNGKVRGKVKVAAEADNATVEAAALADPNVQNFTQQGEVKKVIVVPGRLVNIVVV